MTVKRARQVFVPQGRRKDSQGFQSLAEAARKNVERVLDRVDQGLKSLAITAPSLAGRRPSGRLRRWIPCLVLLTAVSSAHAQETEPAAVVPGEAFVNANAAYEAGEFTRAIALYEKLLERGHETGHLHYNLGNAYLRNGELGRAIASYLRARVFLPRDQDLEANLAFARRSAKDALRPPGPGPVEQTLFFWHHGLSRGELGTIFVVVNLLLWSVLVLRLFRRGSEVLRWTFMALLILVLAIGGSLAVHHLLPREVAVIVPQEIDVRSDTGGLGTVLFKLHAGTEVRVVDRRDDALRIALPEEGRGGWIDAEHAEVVPQ